MHFRLSAGVFALVGIGLAAEVRVVEEIVAKVNGDIITKSELDRARQETEAKLRQKGISGAELDKMVKEQVADGLRDQIDTLLLVQHGKDLNINVDAEVTKRIAQIQIESKIADPDKFHDYIREGTGVSYEDFRQKIRDQLLTQRVISQEVMSRVTPPHAEVEKYYEEHKKDFVREEQVFLSEILISTEGKTSDQVAQAEKRSKDLVARARKGEKFGELARQYSDAESKDAFGQLPPYKRGQLEKSISDIAFKEKKGYVTDPIRVPSGFEILKIEERYEAGQAPLGDVENEIMEKITMPQMQPKVRELLTKLREDAFLEIRAGYLDSGAAQNKDTAWKDPATLKPETTTKEEVASHKRNKRLLWVVPVPGTSTGGQKTATAAKRPGESSATAGSPAAADRSVPADPQAAAASPSAAPAKP
jgi:peptidyl-prolyl cis-trans isomerase SurA